MDSEIIERRIKMIENTQTILGIGFLIQAIFLLLFVLFD